MSCQSSIIRKYVSNTFLHISEECLHVIHLLLPLEAQTDIDGDAKQDVPQNIQHLTSLFTFKVNREGEMLDVLARKLREERAFTGFILDPMPLSSSSRVRNWLLDT